MTDAKTSLMDAAEDSTSRCDSSLPSVPGVGQTVVKPGMLTFPSPAPLKGVKTRATDILKMMDVGIKLPTSSKLDIAGVNVSLSQSSRVSLFGAKGFEKPLLLKVLKGEMRPTEGTHMMLQGLGIAHVNPALLKGFEHSPRQTPAEYMLANCQCNAGDGATLGTDVHQVKEPFTQERIVQHLLDFGLDRTSATQDSICHMSKTTQAKLVLAVNLWPKPQILILDEFDQCFEQNEIPGLITAVNKFTGGVLVISSNKAFADAITNEKWNMNNGSLVLDLHSSRKAELMPAILECGSRSLLDSTLNASEKNPATQLASTTLQSKEYIKRQILEIERKINEAKTKPLTDSEAWELFDMTNSLKKLLFVANAVEVPAGSVQGRIVGVKLMLGSRVAAVGDEGRSISEVLLGHRKTKSGKPQRHEGLAVVHLGPHLTGAPFATAELALSAIASELRSKKPQVVVLDEARHAGDEVWGQAFAILLESETMRAFRGAVVVCVAEVTPAIKSVCSQRWTGDAGWLWQDSFESDDFEILEDVIADDRKDVQALLEEVTDISQQYFNEDSVEKTISRGWAMSLLTFASVEGVRTFAGFISYKLPSPPKAELHIARLAVPRYIQRGGCGFRLMRYILTKAARMPQSECKWISLSSLDTATPFYENFGFIDMTVDDIEDPDHFQTWMELQNFSVVSES